MAGETFLPLAASSNAIAGRCENPSFSADSVTLPEKDSLF